MTEPEPTGRAEPVTLDERGRRCPLPVIALARAAAERPGGLVRLLADDPAAEHDVPAWCRMKGAELVGVELVSAEPFDGGPAVAYVVRLPGSGANAG